MKLLVHKFRMGDVEDPELFAAEPIYQWQQTEKGKWVMKHTQEQPVFFVNPSPEWLGYEVVIYAYFSDPDTTYFKLKWS